MESVEERLFNLECNWSKNKKTCPGCGYYMPCFRFSIGAHERYRCLNCLTVFEEATTGTESEPFKKDKE